MLVGYMRVSSDSDRQSTNLQRDALLAVGVDARHLFEDHASGAKDDRAGLARALEFVRPGDVLVVWKLDRLGRSLSHLLAIVTSLKEKQVAFRSLTENLDTTTPSGEFLFQVFGALAQYERALIQERVVAGLAAARKRGRIGGRPQAVTREELGGIVACPAGGTTLMQRKVKLFLTKYAMWSGSSGGNPLAGSHGLSSPRASMPRARIGWIS